MTLTKKRPLSYTINKRLFKEKGNEKIEAVILTALGVGGATVIGALIGFFLKGILDKHKQLTLGFAGGVMIGAAVLGLLLPAIEYSGSGVSLALVFVMIFIGAALINITDAFFSKHEKCLNLHKKDNNALLFVLAIAIHNLPEGISAGVGFGTGDTGTAIFIALGIALQNIPEGMIIISPMLSLGYSKGRTLFYAAMTGVIEIIGTFIGYYAVSFSNAILPFFLSFAGGIMLYVTLFETLPDALNERTARLKAVYSAIIGFCIMLLLDILL